MKKHLTAFVLFGLSTSLFAIECPLNYFKKLKKIKCPESVIKESTKEQKDLFFCGEIMDVDGITGGFNFQHAWTSGWLAAQHMGQMA